MAKQTSTDMIEGEKEKPIRVMLISTPRSVSTAFLKCMSSVDGSLAFLEPYVMASWFGKDAKFENPYDGFINLEDFAGVMEDLEAAKFDHGYEISEISYAWCKEQLEREYPNKKLIFCKEITFGIRDHLQDLPLTFRYIFLIRNPLLVFPSWKKMHQRILRIPIEDLDLNKWTESMIPQSKGSIYREICDQYDFVKTHRDPNPIVIDADDLLANPSSIMQACFKAIGMPYSDSILKWNASEAITEKWVAARSCFQVNKVAGVYREAFTSSKFFEPKILPNPDDLTQDERQFAQEGMPFYEKLYRLRLQ